MICANKAIDESQITFTCLDSSASDAELSDSSALTKLIEARFASRLAHKDPTLWGRAAEAEARSRLGWVNAPGEAESLISAAADYRAVLEQSGVRKLVLCGMGGSSLGPEMMAQHAGIELAVLDTTHPAALQKVAEHLTDTAFIVSSKSGTTVETRSHLAYLEQVLVQAGIDAAKRIIVITDPATDLERHARQRGYRVFLADPKIGGRFSAFSAFGVVPVVLAGADVKVLCADAQSALSQISRDTSENPALRLALEMVKHKSALLLATNDQSFGFEDWVEQLVAESTGKEKTGILPVVIDESTAEQVLPAASRCVLEGSLGSLLMTWMFATCAAAYLLGVNPFNQPDVEATKQAARSLLQGDASIGEVQREDSHAPSEVFSWLDDVAAQSDYVALHIFGESADPDSEIQQAAERLQRAFWQKYGVAFSIGYGPRFLHAAGQFHKGGGGRGAFLQLLQPWNHDAMIPDAGFSFGRLMRAQADGDAEVLRSRGKSVLQVLGEPLPLLLKLSTLVAS